jgi:hypothetical protein
MLARLPTTGTGSTLPRPTRDATMTRVMGDRRARVCASRGVEVCPQISRRGEKAGRRAANRCRIDGVHVRDAAARKAHGDGSDQEMPVRREALMEA